MREEAGEERLTQICNVSLGEVYIIPWCHGDITPATPLSNISIIINNQQHFHIKSLPKCEAICRLLTCVKINNNNNILPPRKLSQYSLHYCLFTWNLRHSSL